MDSLCTEWYTYRSSRSIMHGFTVHWVIHIPFFTFNNAQHRDDDRRLHANRYDCSMQDQPQLLAQQLHWTIHVGKILEYQLSIHDTAQPLRKWSAQSHAQAILKTRMQVCCCRTQQTNWTCLVAEQVGGGFDADKLHAVGGNGNWADQPLKYHTYQIIWQINNNLSARYISGKFSSVALWPCSNKSIWYYLG